MTRITAVVVVYICSIKGKHGKNQDIMPIVRRTCAVCKCYSCCNYMESVYRQMRNVNRNLYIAFQIVELGKIGAREINQTEISRFSGHASG